MKLLPAEQSWLATEIIQDFHRPTSFSKNGVPKEKKHWFQKKSLAFSVANGRLLQRKDPYFELLKTQLSPTERETLSGYLHKQPMVLVRRTRPEREFVNAVNEHAAAIGTMSLTRLQLIEKRPDRRGNGKTDILNEEEKIVTESKEAVRRAIRIYSFSQTPEMNDITKKLNEMSDSFEYEYEALLTEKAIRNKDNATSSIILASAVGLERILEKTTALLGDYGSRLVSQVWGEAVVLLVQEGRNIGIFAKKKLQQLVKILQRNHEKSRPKESIVHQEKKHNHPVKDIVAPLALTTGITTLLSKGSKLVYGAIPLLNTSIVTAFQFGKKVRILHESLGTIELTSDQRELLIPPLVRKAVHVLPGLKKWIDTIDPAYLIAYSDLLSAGKIGRATLLGSTAATAFVIGAVLFAPITIPAAVLYTLAGVAIENVVTLGYGLMHQAKDVYKHEFISYVKQQLQKDDVSESVQ